MKRQIVEQEAVRLALNEAEADWERANDAWEAATWVMAHDPPCGGGCHRKRQN